METEARLVHSGRPGPAGLDGSAGGKLGEGRTASPEAEGRPSGHAESRVRLRRLQGWPRRPRGREASARSLEGSPLPPGWSSRARKRATSCPALTSVVRTTRPAPYGSPRTAGAGAGAGAAASPQPGGRRDRGGTRAAPTLTRPLPGARPLVLRSGLRSASSN